MNHNLACFQISKGKQALTPKHVQDGELKSFVIDCGDYKVPFPALSPLTHHS